MTYRIWCEVYGGVTGHRAAWLKSDGKPAEFATLNKAQKEAHRLCNRTNGNPYAIASFTYTPRKFQQFIDHEDLDHAER